MKRVSVYAHVPFCVKKCAYCDFVSWPGMTEHIPGYFAALKRELEGYRESLDGYEARSVYIGGGTPSLAGAEEIRGLTDALRRALPFAEDCEVTLEANPGTVTREKLDGYLAAGINRLSLGAQSFCDSELAMLGRIHTSRVIDDTVHLAREAGFANISLDLMYELPGQTIGTWRDTLEHAVSLGLPHLSAYTLIPEEGTVMYDRLQNGELTQPDEDTCAQMRALANAFLREKGYERYEISNYARPGFYSRHNSVYWERGEYIGLGCAAHSFFGNARYANTEELREYLDGRYTVPKHTVPPEEALEEDIMLRLRTGRGIDMRAFEAAYGAGIAERVLARARELARSGFFEACGERLVLNDRGFDVHNAIVLELIEAAQKNG